jgi:hypothetical protein
MSTSNQGVTLVLKSSLQENKRPRKSLGEAVLLAPSGEVIPGLKSVSLTLDVDSAVIVTAQFYAGAVKFADDLTNV